jgi:predicted nucleic acid-binding protein
MENTEENCEKIWQIWKKGKLKSEMIWKIWKISVLVKITPKETSSSSFSCLYTLFFRIEKNHLGIVFF